jgi:hypothetical protein
MALGQERPDRRGGAVCAYLVVLVTQPTHAKVLETLRKISAQEKRHSLYLTGSRNTLLACGKNMRHKVKNVLFWVLVSFCVFLGLLVCNSMGKIIS